MRSFSPRSWASTFAVTFTCSRPLAVEHRLLGAVHQRLQRDARALLLGQALDQQVLAALDAVLLAACLHDRVHVRSWCSRLASPLRAACLGSRTAPSAPAAAAPRFGLYGILLPQPRPATRRARPAARRARTPRSPRAPPRPARPAPALVLVLPRRAVCGELRRRGGRSRSGGRAHHLAVLVQQQRARGGAADLLDAHHPLLAHVRGGAGDRDYVAVDLRHRVVDVVHVRLDDLDQHLVAGVERQRALLDLLAACPGR